MAHLSKSMFIGAPVEKIDGIVRDPRKWPGFWVGMADPESVKGEGGPGTVVSFELVTFGLKTHETQRVVAERHDPDGSTHWRWEFEGATRGWITCDHVPADGGTQITTEFDYTPPLSVVGKVVDLLVLERVQRRDFNASLENLKELAEALEPAALLH